MTRDTSNMETAHTERGIQESALCRFWRFGQGARGPTACSVVDSPRGSSPLHRPAAGPTSSQRLRRNRRGSALRAWAPGPTSTLIQ